LSQQYPNQRKLTVINLVNENGKESALGRAFLDHISDLNRRDINYIPFDFHEQCKGLKFENTSILIDQIKDALEDNSYCWVDNQGFIFKQNVLFRVNCIDCLDRTNVIQLCIARNALENQLTKLGIFIPPNEFPIELRTKFQSLWANNGDAISQQYAGTGALKGDFTRTGERNLSGIMKDGLMSANRFDYLKNNKFI
jgi:phosphatidylinositol 4-phosphatase